MPNTTPQLKVLSGECIWLKLVSVNGLPSVRWFFGLIGPKYCGKKGSKVFLHFSDL